ncbi:carboxy-S-adenosyl-L-methionine synthase CmoA [Hahella sp. KA22]|uniref:carboxy-S-adenosyl-L-methionine synthase CmoA n=1 Tax=Hahella sp. KA22 TaxID=1628392 RepID=UPI000FDF42FB|nr:carboxy-S-adenosyl-L-methionine synthase CmoA [Hahella sp. KA22]AZZ93401.1 carboxy-S-adenosyl-L-methionine synthase CmoA [Hahella sp. KA22]QAY56776.1 carboxy-S-adenosyl-L-methionine synthase CmoA [Hahella sp. KA22]
MSDSKDRIYQDAKGAVGAFEFDERVAHVFTDMINRSVPGYTMMLEMIGVISRRYAQAGTHCYDLGCSLGASTLAIRSNLEQFNESNDKPKVIGVDNSAAMVERCRVNMERMPSAIPTEILCQDIQSTSIENASIAVMNFTLQFIPLAQREDLLHRIAVNMKPGGAMVLSEKIEFAGADKQHTLFDLHHDFKRSRGYSDLEIAQKRSALENVLVPETIEAHIERLQRAGFSQAYLWFQCFNFVSFLAIK